MKRILALFLLIPFICISAHAENCDFVGIKTSKEFLKKNQRKCFATSKAAKQADYTAYNKNALVGYSFLLDGASEVPPVTTSATGKCLVTVDRSNSSLDVLCTHTVVSATMAHVHEGAVGVDGGIICTLGDGTSPLTATCPLTATQLAEALGKGLYVNVHSVANSGGEVRGQIQ